MAAGVFASAARNGAYGLLNRTVTWSSPVASIDSTGPIWPDQTLMLSTWRWRLPTTSSTVSARPFEKVAVVSMVNTYVVSSGCSHEVASSGVISKFSSVVTSVS